jgi:hypothetical protein
MAQSEGIFCRAFFSLNVINKKAPEWGLEMVRGHGTTPSKSRQKLTNRKAAADSDSRQ